MNAKTIADRPYRIRTNGEFIEVRAKPTGILIAEYRGVNQRALRRLIDAHLLSGGTIANYPW